MKAEKFVIIQDAMLKNVRVMEAVVNRARKKVTIPAMSQLRPATSADMFDGNIIYHANQLTHQLEFWHTIDYVMYPDDKFKAYMADDGCRYGLQDAYVRKEPA